MTKTPQPHTVLDPGAIRAARIRQLVMDCLDRRATGEAVSDESLIGAHPELMPELAEELSAAALIKAAEQIAGLRRDVLAALPTEPRESQTTPSSIRRLLIRCPHCHRPTEIVADRSLSGIVCSSCQSPFSLVDDDGGSNEAIPARIGHFELLERLGMGGFGAVWKARDTELDRFVALKVPRRGRLTPDEADQFLREARTAAQLNHPHIVGIHEIGRDGDTVYIVSDLIEGKSLAESIAKQRISAPEASSLCEKIALALQHAHDAGVVHRDLKPANILIDHAGQPHITDFGLARRETETTVTADGQLVGTPAYMSPEQARGDSHRADHRSDIYSLGVVLFELLTGEIPFRGSSATLPHQIIHDEPPHPRSLDGHVPRDLETICLKCLEKDPARRYASAQSLSDDLRRYQREEPITARPVSKPERLWRWCRRRPVVSSLSGLVAILLLSVAAISIHSSMRSEQASQQARWQQYLSDMHVATQSLADANVGRVMELLNRHDPQPGQKDLRGFEWYYLWRQCQRTLSQPTLYHGPRVQCLAVSPDGRMLATGGSDYTVKLWDLRTGKIQWSRPVNGWANAMAFLPDGQTLASRTNLSINLWNVHTGAAPFDNAADGNMTNKALALSPDGYILAATETHSTIRVWDTKSQQELRTIDTSPRESHWLAYSPDGRVLASVDKDGSIQIWDLSTWTQRHTLPSIGGGVGPICFTQDGERLVCGGADGRIVVWDLDSCTQQKTLIAHSKPITSLAFSTDGRLLASASHDGSSKLWDAERFEERDRLLSTSGDVTSLAFSPNGQQLLVGGTDGIVRLWELSASRPIDVLRSHTGGVFSVAVSPDGQRLAAGGSEGSVKIWDTTSRKEQLDLPNAHNGNVRAIAFDRTGKVLASGGADGRIAIWDAESGSRKSVVENHGWIFSSKFSSDGRRIFFCICDDGKDVGIWDLASQEIRRGYSTQSGEADRVDVSLDGQVLAVGDASNGLVELRYVRNGLLIGSFSVPSLECLALSSDSQTLATGSRDGSINLWALHSMREPKVIRGHSGHVQCVVFSPDGRILASASADQTVRVWDVETGQERAALLGHTGHVRAVAFSRDGRTIASGSLDDTIRLWHSASEEEVQAAGSLHGSGTW